MNFDKSFLYNQNFTPRIYLNVRFGPQRDAPNRIHRMGISGKSFGCGRYVTNRFIGFLFHFGSPYQSIVSALIQAVANMQPTATSINSHLISANDPL